MEIQTAGWSGMWPLLLVFFVVIPSIRWSVSAAGWGMRNGKRWGRYYGRRWGADWDLDDDPPARKEIDGFRAELESRLTEVDALQGRVAELENRLDFAERLLAERHDRVLVSRDAPPA